MQLTDLAEGFAKIEATTKHHLQAALLADLFRRAPEDAHTLPYLLEGRLGPPYAAPDIGVDERRLALAIEDATGTPVEQVWSLYKQRGDLGLVAEELLPPQGQPVSVQEAFQRLLSIARAAGPGAYEEKVALFANLLRRLGGHEARYLVRIAQGRLRLGVGDATIMDALSVASAGDRSLRPRIERAYSFCSDLGLVAETLLSRGPDAVDHIGPTPGRPVLSALAERLPTAGAVIKKLGRVIAEPKYDGLRLQAHKDGDRVWLFTRRLEDVTDALPDIARAVGRQLLARQAILDGEAVGFDPRTGMFLPFQETVRRRRKHGVERMEILYPLRYYLFDLLYLDGYDLRQVDLADRKRALAAVVQATERVRISEHFADGAELLEAATQMGLEGIVAKRATSCYEPRRSREWLKIKLVNEAEFLICGFTAGERDYFGALVLGARREGKLVWVGNAGAGFSEAVMRDLYGKLEPLITSKSPFTPAPRIPRITWVEPRLTAEIRFANWTRDGKLRAPVFLRLKGQT